MTETLTVADYVAVVAYFVLVLGVGIWSSFKGAKDNASGYFLAGKHMNWIPVGASLFASNVGAPMFIGLAGAGAAAGYSVVLYEWHATFLLIALGWFFLPVYISSGAFTVPEYLKKRFGGRRLRICLSILALLLYILTKISVEIYCGALFMQLLLGWNLYYCIIGILVVTALYTVIGGLVAVMYTDTLQTVILLIGACILTVRGFQEIGNMENLGEGFLNAVSNRTLAYPVNHSCGLPPKASMHIWRDAITGDIPWPGALFGLTLIGMWVWCADQLMVQRTLSAKNMSHAKAGTLLAAALKIFPFFLWIIPGMISRILYPEEVACSSPEDCYAACKNKAGCSNIAYPLLVLRILPDGVRGLMLAALLAALMSSLTSIFNSASSMFTMDVWPYIRKNPSSNELMVVGRIAVLVCTGIGIVWLPVMQQAQGGQLWGYLQAITAYTAPPWTVLFLMAMLWKRTTEQGAFWGLIGGLSVGFIRLCLDFAYQAPFCGSGDVDTRPGILKHVHFLYFAMILAIITATLMTVISLCTKPQTAEQLGRSTWWSKNDEDECVVYTECKDFEGDHDCAVDDDLSVKINGGDDALETPQKPTMLVKMGRWLCGINVEKKPKLSKAEEAEMMKRFTSLKENKHAKSVLNMLALALALLTVFLTGYFS